MILSVGGVLAAIIVGWMFLWRPLAAGTSELGGTVAGKHRLLAGLRQVEASGAGTGPAAAAAPTQSLVLLVDQTHRTHGLGGTLSANRPDGSDGIRVTFQSASFDQLVSWLGTLERSYGVRVEQASFDGTNQPGLVRATLVLRRS